MRAAASPQFTVAKPFVSFSESIISVDLPQALVSGGHINGSETIPIRTSEILHREVRPRSPYSLPPTGRATTDHWTSISRNIDIRPNGGWMTLTVPLTKVPAGLTDNIIWSPNFKEYDVGCRDCGGELFSPSQGTYSSSKRSPSVPRKFCSSLRPDPTIPPILITLTCRTKDKCA